jgi:hypothetical protein
MIKLWRTKCMSNLTHYVCNIKQDKKKGENREKLWGKTKIQGRDGAGNWYYEQKCFAWWECCLRSKMVLRWNRLLPSDSFVLHRWDNRLLAPWYKSYLEERSYSTDQKRPAFMKPEYLRLCSLGTYQELRQSSLHAFLRQILILYLHVCVNLPNDIFFRVWCKAIWELSLMHVLQLRGVSVVPLQGQNTWLGLSAVKHRTERKFKSSIRLCGGRGYLTETVSTCHGYELTSNLMTSLSQPVGRQLVSSHVFHCFKLFWLKQ